VDPISERAREALEDHRVRTGFGPGRKDAVLRRLEQSIADGGAERFVAELDHGNVSGVGSTDPAAGKRARRRVLGGGLALALAAGLGALWWVGVPTAQLADETTPAQAVHADGVDAARSVAVPRAGAPAPAAPAVEPAPTAEPASASVRPVKSRARAAASAAPTAGDLAAELRLLRRARRALAAGDLASAREVLSTHAQAFPTGQLAPERDALAVELSCRTDPVRGREARAVFLARHAGSPHAGRVRGLACGDPGEEKPPAE
jgi:hypothetical protein